MNSSFTIFFLTNHFLGTYYMLGRGNIMINKLEGDLKESSLEERVKLKMLFYENRKGFRTGKGAKDVYTVLITSVPLVTCK